MGPTVDGSAVSRVDLLRCDWHLCLGGAALNMAFADCYTRSNHRPCRIYRGSRDQTLPQHAGQPWLGPERGASAGSFARLLSLWTGVLGPNNTYLLRGAVDKDLKIFWGHTKKAEGWGG